ncbi:hypothetical protein EPI10_002329 [Gossypium australe]|uniref:Uncharacterized protein n=1 Tax=Gossypium australe TaxID=47621 RepID=A0A5B6VDM2_9ROSI|nr:hypothetical protein EPI10_002329 [Gossypium australe]
MIEENSKVTLKGVQDVGFFTRSGKCYDPTNARTEPLKEKTLVVEPIKGKAARPESSVNEPTTENEAKDSETHHNALMMVLNETYIADNISINKLDRFVNNLSTDKFISFNDDEIPLRVLIDNGFALNVLPLSTLNRLTVDSSHMKACHNIVRAFDGTERKGMGKIKIPFLIGPNTYEMGFLVMDIKPTYNYLLGRSWIHSVGAVPLSLHKKLKLVTEGQPVTINIEEDIIASVTSDAPYIRADEDAVECSFQSTEFLNATFIAEGCKILVPNVSRTTRMDL